LYFNEIEAKDTSEDGPVMGDRKACQRQNLKYFSNSEFQSPV